jgi:hypothetical protein
MKCKMWYDARTCGNILRGKIKQKLLQSARTKKGNNLFILQAVIRLPRLEEPFDRTYRKNISRFRDLAVHTAHKGAFPCSPPLAISRYRADDSTLDFRVCTSYSYLLRFPLPAAPA